MRFKIQWIAWIKSQILVLKFLLAVDLLADCCSIDDDLDDEDDALQLGIVYLFIYTEYHFVR